jgi:hypothetical protein
MVPLVPAIAFDMQRKGHPGRFDCRVWYADLLDFVVGSRCADLDGWRSIPDRKIWSRPPRQPAHCFHSTGQKSSGLAPANSYQPCNDGVAGKVVELS